MDTPTTANAGPAILFDLDGTLIDSVYQHVLAWREALERDGMNLSVWKMHRRIGMSGGLLVNALLRETGRDITLTDAETLQKNHAESYARMLPQVRPLPGARELLAYLGKSGVPHAIATSGRLISAGPALEMLGVDPAVPVITRDKVRYAKPDPDLFLAAAEQLGVPIHDSIVVGDSVWDLLAARRAERSGSGFFPAATGRKNSNVRALTVSTRDPADMLDHLDEIGVRVRDRTSSV